MKFFLSTSLTVMLVVSCSDQSSRSSQVKDYDVDFGKEFVFLDPEGLVNYEVCDSMGTIDGHRCKLSYDYPKIEQNRYISDIASALKIDPLSLVEKAKVTGQFENELEKTEATMLANIEHYEDELKKAKDPAKRAELTTRIEFYKSNLGKFQDTVKPLLTHLFLTESLKFERSFASDLENISILTAPFGRPKLREKVEGAGPVHMSPETGEVYAFYQNICWYDVTGVQREKACGDIRPSVSQYYRYSGSTVKTTSLNIRRHNPNSLVKHSCKIVYGDSFSIQSLEATKMMAQLYTWDLSELKSLADYPELSNWEKDEKLLAFSKSYPTAHFLSTHMGDLYLAFQKETFLALEDESEKDLQSNYICSAPARIADRDGDIDEDGIINESDRCNVKYNTPEDHTLVTDVTSSRLGCFKDQKTDEEFPWLKSKLPQSPAPSTPSSPPDACTVCSNKTVKISSSPDSLVKLSDIRVGRIPTGPNSYIVVKRTGNYDLYVSFSDGSKGAWVEGQYADSTKDSYQLEATFKR